MTDLPTSVAEETAPASITSTVVSTDASKELSSKSPITPSSPAPQSTTITISTAALSEQDAAAKRTAEARTAFLASLHSVGSSADAGLQTRAADITSNSLALAKQQAQLDDSSAALAKETDKYQKLADETRTKLKDIGDVQNFAEVIERELLVLEETLRIVEDGEDKWEDVDEDEEEGNQEGRIEQENTAEKKKKKKWWF